MDYHFKKVSGYSARYIIEELPFLVIVLKSELNLDTYSLLNSSGESINSFVQLLGNSLVFYSDDPFIELYGFAYHEKFSASILNNCINSLRRFPFLVNRYDFNNISYSSDSLQAYIPLKDNLSDFTITANSSSNADNQVLFEYLYLDEEYFSTNLYPELLDNSEQFQMAKSFLIDTDPDKQLDPTYWTDTQLKFFKFVEEYNKNVLMLRSTRKVQANTNVTQLGTGGQVDLGPIFYALLDISSKLQRVDENQETKNITQTINDLSLSNQTVITTVEKAPYNPLLDDDFEDF